MINKLSLVLLIIINYGCNSAVNAYLACQNNPKEYAKAAKQISAIYIADQKDRENFTKFSSFNSLRILKRDEKRRTKISTLFAQGCFKSADDYKKAALIFQHGIVPEHFYQAFIWAKNAVRLGDDSAQYLLNLTIDRFLVSCGFKQLFGSQALKIPKSNCWCLYPIEPLFTDQDRKSKNAKPLAEQIKWLNTLNQNLECISWECSIKLKSVSKDDFPEFW